MKCSFNLSLPETITFKPKYFAIGTASSPKLPEPPVIKTVSPDLASNSSVNA